MYVFIKLLKKILIVLTYKWKDNYVEIIRDSCNNLGISQIIYIYV